MSKVEESPAVSKEEPQPAPAAAKKAKKRKKEVPLPNLSPDFQETLHPKKSKKQKARVSEWLSSLSMMSPANFSSASLFPRQIRLVSTRSFHVPAFDRVSIF